MMKMIIFNCPAYKGLTRDIPDWLDNTNCGHYAGQVPCQDCTDCVLKQIIGLCEQYKKDYNTTNGVWLLANNITNLLNIQEDEEMNRQEVLAKIKQKAIEKIQEDKIIYTPDIEEDKKYRKIFALKTVDLESEISGENIEDYSSIIAKTIKLFLSEQAITGTIKFKIYGLESLHDRDSFNDLVRGIFYYQPIKTNYDRLKSSDIVGVAKILSEEVSKLFLNTEITELAYKCLEQKVNGWLLQEVE